VWSILLIKLLDPLPGVTDQLIISRIRSFRSILEIEKESVHEINVRVGLSAYFQVLQVPPDAFLVCQENRNHDQGSEFIGDPHPYKGHLRQLARWQQPGGEIVHKIDREL